MALDKDVILKQIDDLLGEFERARTVKAAVVDTEVGRMIDGIRDFVARHPA